MLEVGGADRASEQDSFRDHLLMGYWPGCKTRQQEGERRVLKRPGRKETAMQEMVGQTEICVWKRQ